jgi:4-amino-4-deoxy-L-arabinose transferase-like glycosyltransferase
LLDPESQTERGDEQRDYGFWVALLAFFYASLYLLQHMGTPLGQIAVLDGREILAWASAFAQGEWPGEPFYRAPFYPLLLSGLLRLGVSEADYMLAAQLLNLAAHVLSAWLIYCIGIRVWQHKSAALVSGALYSVFPLAAFYVGEPLDISLGTCFFLAALLCLLGGARERSWLGAAAAGLLMALAVATRPHFLTVAIILPILPLLLRSGEARIQLTTSAAALTIGLLGLGTLNAWQSGQFQILPSQGGYNLWAANKPGANGLYYQQQFSFLSHDKLANPARLESEQIYQLETGQPADEVAYGAIASYWRERAVSSIIDQPGAWLSLELRKLAALLHNTEQYNNKTFAFHKANNAVLRFNPLSWGVLLVAGLAGLVGAWRKPELQALLLVGASYAAGVLLFYASARFRFPLVGLLCIGAGGLILLWQQRSVAATRTLWPWLLGFIGIGVFCFYPFSWSKASATFDEDRLLLARAHAQLGQYRKSITLLDEIVAQPHNQQRALDLLCSAQFNHLRELQPAQWMAVLPKGIDACRRVADQSPQAEWILAFELWLSGHHDLAISGWRSIATASGVEMQRALACLILADQLAIEERRMLADLPASKKTDLLLLAESTRGDHAATEELQHRYHGRAVAQEQQWLLQVFKTKENGTQ